jgi:hypothetical protein
MPYVLFDTDTKIAFDSHGEIESILMVLDARARDKGYNLTVQVSCDENTSLHISVGSDISELVFVRKAKLTSDWQVYHARSPWSGDETVVKMNSAGSDWTSHLGQMVRSKDALKCVREYIDSGERPTSVEWT